MISFLDYGIEMRKKREEGRESGRRKEKRERRGKRERENNCIVL